MEIIVSKVADVCMGVRRSLDLCNQLTQECDTPIYTVGPVIHNPAVVDGLANQGVHVATIESLIETPREEDTCVIIRAHGITPEQHTSLKSAGYRVFDGTCPYVLRSQKKILTYKDSHYVVIVGDRNHPEVVGLVGCFHQGCVVSSYDEWSALIASYTRPLPILLIAQTTCDPALYDTIVAESKSIESITVVSSICEATRIRQEALKDLCKQVSAVLIVGGKKSANTKKLVSLAKQCGVQAYHIEGVEDIPSNIYDNRKVGIALGASTPRDQLDEIIATLRRNA